MCVCVCVCVCRVCRVCVCVCVCRVLCVCVCVCVCVCMCLGKQVLSTQNILVHIMVPISCSICVIQNFVEFLINFCIYEEILDVIQITDKNKKLAITF